VAVACGKHYRATAGIYAKVYVVSQTLVIDIAILIERGVNRADRPCQVGTNFIPVHSVLAPHIRYPTPVRAFHQDIKLARGIQTFRAFSRQLIFQS
jgi:hypothetical protein